jgi:hypothetical protein
MRASYVYSFHCRRPGLWGTGSIIGYAVATAFLYITTIISLPRVWNVEQRPHKHTPQREMLHCYTFVCDPAQSGGMTGPTVVASALSRLVTPSALRYNAAQLQGL